MENLYKELRNKKIHLNSFNANLGNADYYLSFVEDFIPQIVNHTIDNLTLKDIKDISSLDDIKLKYTIHFFQERHESDPAMRIDDNIIFMHLPASTYKYLKERITFFFEHSEMVTDFGYDSKSLEPDAVTFETTLAHLIACYGLEIAKDHRIEDSFKGVTTLLTKSISATDSLSSHYTDELHDRVFEQEFLDNYVVKIIKLVIANLNQRNYIEKEKKDHPVDVRVVLTTKPTNKDFEIAVTKEELESLLPLFDGFMRFYNLGSANYLYDISDEKVGITFKTHLNDLIDAYYMEKQRIEYFQNHHKDEKQISF